MRLQLALIEEKKTSERRKLTQKGSKISKQRKLMRLTHAVRCDNRNIIFCFNTKYERP